jgi:tetratricopeptide (TPR) repeat protein
MTDSSDVSELLRDGEALAHSGQLDAAIDRLQAALKRKPEHYVGWLGLSRLLFKAERFGEAIRIGQFTEQLDPLAAQFQTIQQAIHVRDYQAAEHTANTMLEAIPGHPRAILTIAHVRQAFGDFEGAAAIIETGLKTSPANMMLRTTQLSALEQCGQYAKAIEAAEAIAMITPSAQALWGLVTILMRYGQNEAALTTCDRLEPLITNNPGQQSATALIRAQLYRILGRQEESLRAFRQCLALNPRNATAWWGLADLKTYRFTDEDRIAIAGLATQPDLDPLERSLAAFALAKAEGTASGAAQAMAHYQRANALHPASAFNLDTFDTAVARITSTVTSDALATQASLPTNMPKPIFIIGLPRSGSTLVEQILASHSKIEGTIEQPTLPALKRRAHLICAKQLGGDYLDMLGGLSQETLTELGESYLAESTVFRPNDAPLFTDKLPHNFEHVGLIHKILPHAAIIDVRRNPMDCGYSLYKQHFTQGTEFSYRLQSIGRYYNGYLKIMDHWDAVLPGRVFHLQYEDLVAEPEPVIRVLLDHIGVAFEETCLSFHQTRRAVRTASSEQVRQPLNAKGVRAWKTVEAELEPLKTALGNATLERFSHYL